MVNHPNRTRLPGVLREPKPAEIRDVRLEHDLSQSDAAKLVDGTLRTWQAWEAGERRMHLGFWRLFRARLALRNGAGMDAMELLLGEQP
jgi:putative transcriptional regulator